VPNLLNRIPTVGIQKMLSNQSIRQLSQSIKSDVIEHLYESDEYTEFLQTILPEIVSDLLGDIDEELKHEIAFNLFDSIVLK
jgi:hypothetical protein